MKDDFDCPVVDCDECEFNRTESWCAKAIPINNDVYDEKYRIYMEGFWEAVEWCENHYKAMEELLQEYADENERLKEKIEFLTRLS